MKGQAKGPRLKPLLSRPLFHGLKAMASTVASLREALCAVSVVVLLTADLPELAGDDVQGAKATVIFFEGDDRICEDKALGLQRGGASVVRR